MCCQVLLGGPCQSTGSFPAPVGLILPVWLVEKLKFMEMVVLDHLLPHHRVRAHFQRREAHPDEGAAQEERQDNHFHQLDGRKNLLASGHI